MTPWGQTSQAVLKYLSEHPDSTRQEIADDLGLSRKAVYDAVRRLRSKEGSLRKRVYVASWRRVEGRGGFPQMLLRLGSRRDSPRPDCGTKQEQQRLWDKRYRERHRLVRRLKKLERPTTPWEVAAGLSVMRIYKRAA